MLTEIFKEFTPDITWTSAGPMKLGEFSVSNHDYMIQFIKMKKNDPIHSNLSSELITNNTWFFAFAAVDDDDGDISDKLTGRHDAIPIISCILQTLVNFSNENNIDVLYLGVSKKDTKLKALYEKIISKYTHRYNWSIENTTTANFFGDEKYIWIVKKN